MNDEPRLRAQEQLANLLALLKGLPDREAVAPLVELGGHLDRAVASFHLEAIRFRMYSLGRSIQRAEISLPPEVATLYEALRVSLEAAGFHTRSVSS